MSEDIYNKISWEFKKDLLNHNITIDFLENLLRENKITNSEATKRKVYLEELCNSKIQHGLYDEDSCIEIVEEHDDFLDIRVERSVEILDKIFSNMYEEDGDQEYAQTMISAWGDIYEWYKKQTESGE